MKIFVILIAALIAMFFLLGLKSQKGEAKGLVDGRLAEPGAAPNSVCSETGTQPEKLVEPVQGSLADIKAAILATGGTITSENALPVSCPTPA